MAVASIDASFEEGPMTTRYDAQIDLDQDNNTHTCLVRWVGTDQRVLELGASSGYMTAVLKDRGNLVTAVEIDEAAVPALRRVADDVVVTDLNVPGALEGIEGPFDVVLAGDVLEHLLDGEGVLRSAVQLLKPDGRVVLSVPNVAHIDLRLALLQGRFEYHPTGLLDDTHVRFFTHDSLVTMIHDAGLEITDIERIIVKAFHSELGVEAASFPPDVVDAAYASPEAETYQFVVRATPDRGTKAARRRSERVIESARAAAAERQQRDRSAAAGPSLAEQLDAARQFLVTAEGDRDEARAQLVSAIERIDELESEATGLRRELAVAREELTAACIGEARAKARAIASDAALHELQLEAEAVARERESLAALASSRTYRAVDLCRRVTVPLLPPGSRRRAALGRVRRPAP